MQHALAFCHLSNEKKPGCLGYIGDYTIHLFGDYFINHYKDPIIKQAVFHGK